MNTPYAGLRKDCMAIGYQYAERAHARLLQLGLPAPDKFLLVEGSGRVVYQRLKQYGKDKVVEFLNEYLLSEKFEEYPRLLVALDSDTLVKIQTRNLK